MRSIVACLALGAALGCQAAEPPLFTERCNTQLASKVSLGVADTFMDNLHALVHANLPRYFDAVRRLWEPREITLHLVGGNWFADLEYDPRQDPDQIASEIRVDPVLRLIGVTSAQVALPICPAGPPTWAKPMGLSEYRNRIIEHYILADRYEAAALAGGAAGPGWEATREGFATLPPHFCTGADAVHRLYSPALNSHMYTQDPVECGRLRQPGTGWLYEGIAFGAWKPVDGECPRGTSPVWNMFDGRPVHGSLAHRYVARTSLVTGLLLQGWTLEGVAFCVSP
jgi:hypothetical protein